MDELYEEKRISSLLATVQDLKLKMKQQEIHYKKQVSPIHSPTN